MSLSKKVVVIGSEGFLGWHIRCALYASGYETIAVDRQLFWSDEMERSIRDVDYIIHAAGVNRGSDEDVYNGNVELAQRLAELCQRSSCQATVVYLNSTHINKGTKYGDSKIRAAQILQDATEKFVDLVLPNVFGEMGRPFYNSVVSTFCHQLISNMDLSINDDAPLEVIHAQAVADEILQLFAHGVTGQRWMCGHKTSVVSLAEDLKKMHEIYLGNVLPSTVNEYERSLFNTLRSYGVPSFNLHQLAPKADDRGHLIEIVKTSSGGQLFVSWTNPGITRGNHYHRKKIERFVVLEGSARIRMRRMFTADVIEVTVSGESPVSLDIPTLHTHEITNVGSTSLLTAFWADEIFDPVVPDTYFELV
jgi:UDP-2-acetamido-2,6-beta-L-arabino-hexul-4-ose reductase